MTRFQKVLFAIAGGLGAVAALPILPAAPIAALGGLSVKLIAGLLATFTGGVAVRTDAIHGARDAGAK